MKRALLPAAGLALTATLLAACSPASEADAGAAAPDIAHGEKLYANNCATCHMADGSGVSDLQPALVNDPVVMGDPVQVMRVVIQGPDKVPAVHQGDYSNTMPSFAHLSDAEIADLLTYVRDHFGNHASAITAAQVKTVRSQYPAP